MTGRIFDVKEFAVHDGPGARITCFMKGCPLRCLWCHNPEGQSPERELMIRKALCEECGECRIPSESPVYLRYGRDPVRCPKGLITLCGDDLSSGDLLSRVLPMKEMLASMGGGVTFSGGEPLMQWKFLRECLSLFRAEGIHTAVETCGFADEAVFSEMLELADYVLMDLKIMDPEAHLRATGVSNGPILANAEALMSSGAEFCFRTPLIPGYTDGEGNLRKIKEFVGESPWEPLPYNELAGAKYSMLNRIYPLEKERES